jgi:short-subunit dehydrogenase
MNPYFKHKTILITGASSGIGKALAEAFSDSSVTLILCGRNTQNLNQVAERCTGKTYQIYGDLEDPKTLSDLKSCLEALPKGLDIAILNAGTNAYITPEKFDGSLFKSLIKANLFTMIDCTETVLPFLMQSKGQLALMGSIAAYGGLPLSSGYGASKAAIRNMAQSLDVDLRSQGVAVSLISPGFVKTPLTDRNTFEMPFRVTPEKAAEEILKGLAQKSHEIYFPKGFTWLLKAISSLPASLQYWLISRATQGKV